MQDHSDRTGMRIVVELKKGAEPKVVVNQLYQYTPLQSTFSIINIALVNRRPADAEACGRCWRASWSTARRSSAGGRRSCSAGPGSGRTSWKA